MARGKPGTLKIECTGFGLNLVSRNFEFACLIVIDSEDFWHRCGGQVEASWESSALRQSQAWTAIRWPRFRLMTAGVMKHCSRSCRACGPFGNLVGAG
jgi:hypothetical protein